MNTETMGIWIPENALIRLEDCWVKVKDYNFKLPLLYQDITNPIIKSKLPKKFDKIPYKGTMLGYGKVLFKPSDKIAYSTDEWFAIKSYSDIEALPLKEIQYEGNLYRFDFNPIISYNYKESKKTGLSFVKYVII